MNKPPPIESETESIIAWIRSIQVALPKMSAMTLQRESFAHYDRGLRNGEPTAAALAAGIMNVPHLEQKTAAARRSEWSRSRCVEFLRTSAAQLNIELVGIAEKTKSEAVKVAVIDAIYGAIIAAYPHLKAEAADMAVRRKLELTRNGGRTPEPQAPATAPEAPRGTLAEAKRDAAEDAEGDLNQIGHAQLAALKLIHEYVIPAAAASGIVIDAQQASALVMNAIIQSFYGRSHLKMSRTRIEVAK
jgi:hypothetical protein